MMIRKILLQAGLILVLFFGVWGSLAQVNWLHLFGIPANFVEEKLGESYWALYAQTETEVTSPRVIAGVKTIFDRLCKENSIQPESIKIHIFKNSEVNAFAFPNRHLVIYTGLIQDCQHEEELAGVIAHELGHITQGHLMQKLVKETSFLVLATAVGAGGGETAGKLIRLFSSTAYDRKLETEADTMAVNYLLNAQINPFPMADFFKRLAQEEGLPQVSKWISTHPDSESRAQAIITHSTGRITHFRPIMTPKEWEKFKKAAYN